MAKNTLSTTHITPAQSTAGQRISMANTQIAGYDSNNNQILNITPTAFTYSDGSTIRLLAGNHATLGEGFYVSTTATGQNLLFNSGLPLFQVVEEGSVTISSITCANNTQSTATATYNFTGTYSNAPVVLAFYSGTSANLFTGGNYPAGALNVISYGNSGSGLSINIATVCKVGGNSSSATFSVQLLNYGSGGSYTYPSTSLTVYVLQPTA